MKAAYNKKYTLLLVTAVLFYFLSSCSIKPLTIYNTPSQCNAVPHIENVYAISIFNDYVSSELWHTENNACLQVENIFDSTMIGTGGLFIKWNKISGGCNWIGMGIGWDGWTPKNLQEIYHKASIQFMVRTPKGSQSGLPWAMALEDYSGGQAWAGVFSNYIEGQLITENWTRVQIPLTAFDISQFDADITNIKHLIIQFDAEGEIFLDEIQLVASQTIASKTKTIPLVHIQPVIDGKLDPAVYTADPFTLENATVWMSVEEKAIHVYAIIKDTTPMQNNNTGKDIWNGDAFELAFSTNAEANPNRKTFLLSDHHIGIAATQEPKIWDFTSNKYAEGKVATAIIDGGYVIEFSLPTDQFIYLPFTANNTYLLELAIDEGTIEKGRVKQVRWANNYNNDFYKVPQLWGKMLLINETNNN